MTSKSESMKKELDVLIAKGKLLHIAMIGNTQKRSLEKIEKQLKDKKIKLPNFETDYDTWYSEAHAVIKQVLPDRLADFVKQYKDEKRKEIDLFTYGIADYLLDLRIELGSKVVADGSAAFRKMQIQNSILKAATKRFKSSLFDIQEVLQSDIFDSELGAARELTKKGFVRGAGAIAGVVLEKHLSHVCEMHGLKLRKKNPSISDFYQLLKENDVIDTSKWRFIQHLGDLRNLCDHNKDREPTKDDALELVEGVEKVIKTVF